MKKKKPFTSYKAYWWKSDSNDVFYGKSITDITNQAFGKGIPYEKLKLPYNEDTSSCYISYILTSDNKKLKVDMVGYNIPRYDYIFDTVKKSIGLYHNNTITQKQYKKRIRVLSRCVGKNLTEYVKECQYEELLSKITWNLD